MPKLAKTSADDSSYAPSNGSSLPRSVANGKGPAQIYYEEHSRALKVLIAMCRGLCNDHGDAIFVEIEQLWMGMKVGSYCPTAVEYKHDISRCALLKEDNVSPCPAQWSLTKVLQWLDKHPITNPIDRDFVIKTLEEVKGNAILAQAERQEEMDTVEKNGRVKSLICN